jgi:hypothetical protein
MNRERVKAAGTTGRTGGGAAVLERATEPADALGVREAITLRGREFVLEPLDIGDLLEINERFGKLEEFLGTLDAADQGTQLRGIIFLVWLALRKADPDLSPEQREAGEYRLTERQVTRLIPLDPGVLTDLAQKVLRVAGLAEGQAGNAPAPTADLPTGS